MSLFCNHLPSSTYQAVAFVVSNNKMRDLRIAPNPQLQQLGQHILFAYFTTSYVFDQGELALLGSLALGTQDTPKNIISK